MANRLLIGLIALTSFAVAFFVGKYYELGIPKYFLAALLVSLLIVVFSGVLRFKKLK